MTTERRDIEQVGPQARLQLELLELESTKRHLWILVVFVLVALILGTVFILVPGILWRREQLEIRIPPQVLFVLMMAFVVAVLYMVRREMEIQKLRLANLHRILAARSEHSDSMIDSVTNVFSRNFLRELLQNEIARAERNERPLALIMCDLDNFKNVNDRYGHLMGDYVLGQIAGIIKSCVRGSDYVVRYGGDEFLLILPETDSPGGQIVRERIQTKVAEWDRVNRSGDVPISVSSGLLIHTPGQTPEQDLAQVDFHMYAEKRASPPNVAATNGPLPEA